MVKTKSWQYRKYFCRHDYDEESPVLRVSGGQKRWAVKCRKCGHLKPWWGRKKGWR